MAKRRFIAEDIICSITHFAVFYGIIALAVVPLTGRDESIFWALFFAVPFTINFLIRQYIRNTILMIAAHFVVPVLTHFYSDLFYGSAYVFDDIPFYIFVVIALVIMAFYSLIMRISGRHTLDSIFAIIISCGFIIMSFIGLHFGHAYAGIIYPVLIAVTIISYALHIRMTKVDMSLEVITQVSKQPVSQILKFDHKMMLALIVVLIALTLIGQSVVIDPLLRQISQIELQRGRTLPDGPGMPLEPPLRTMQTGLQNLAEMYGPREPNPIIQFLDAVIFLILQSAMATLALILAVTAVVGIYKMLGYKKQVMPYQDGIDEKIFVVPERVKKIRKLPFLFNLNEDKTRKIFRKKIRRHKKMGVPFVRSDTPIDMANRISGENIGPLVKEYEKVRYGRDD